MPKTPADLPFSPAADRNKAPILDVLQGLWPAAATVLEIAAGTGQHAAHFASQQPDWQWQPTEAEAEALPVLLARRSVPNLRTPLQLDVRVTPWPVPAAQFDGVYCANLLHIAPWAVCAALMQGASQCLAAGGRLVLYGPFVFPGEPTAPSNLAFDADLRTRNPAWGLRHIDDVKAQAADAGLTLAQRVDLPANNTLLVFGRTA